MRNWDPKRWRSELWLVRLFLFQPTPLSHTWARWVGHSRVI